MPVKTDSMRNLPAPPPHFSQRKKKILDQLAVADVDYTDASPKGSVDAGIRDLIDEINALDGFVTTSSCAGRVSVFLEGRKAPERAADTADVKDDSPTEIEYAGTGGKGGGGKWLFVSHDPVEKDWETRSDIATALLGLEKQSSGDNTATFEEVRLAESRLIHFKFEPMVRVSFAICSTRASNDSSGISGTFQSDHLHDGQILHVLTASLEHAQVVLRCGLQGGFRESGAVNLLGTAQESATPMIAIRSMGLGFESLIGVETHETRQCTVSSDYMQMLIQLANERFVENTKRVERFRSALNEALQATKKSNDGSEWEDAAVRRERKKAEGLKRRAELKQQQEQQQLNETIESLPNN